MLPIWLVLLAGCDRCPPRPEIVGGTHQTRSRIQSAVDDFYGTLERYQICVPRILVGDPTGSDGQYQEDGDIWVDASRYDGDALETITTHELCHAVEQQTDILEQQPALWTGVEAEPLDAGEAFAETCEVGPIGIQLIGGPCPTDTPGAEAFQIVGEVFSERDVPAPVRSLRIEVASHAFAAPVLTLSSVRRFGYGLALQVTTTAGTEVRLVDRDTGEELPYPPEPEVETEPRFLGFWPVSDAYDDNDNDDDDDDVQLMVGVAIAANGGEARRLVRIRGIEVVSAGCAQLQEVSFEDNGLWTAWVEGNTVRWGRWESTW